MQNEKVTEMERIFFMKLVKTNSLCLSLIDKLEESGEDVSWYRNKLNEIEES